MKKAQEQQIYQKDTFANMSAINTVSITPTFLLKGVNPGAVLKNYLSGFYSDYQIKSKVKVQSNAVRILDIQKESTLSSLFAIRDQNSSLRVFSVPSVEMIKGKKGGRCDNCHLDFFHDAFGIPVRHDELIVSGERIMVFSIDGVLCDFECCYAVLKNEMSKCYRYQDLLWSRSEQLLKFLFWLLYPKDTLVAAQDWRLLKVNNGYMEPEEYKATSHRFYRTGGLIVEHARAVYERFVSKAPIN